MRSAIVVLAVCARAGCGAGAPARQATSEPAPDPERTQDLVPLTTGQAVRAADRVALVVARGSRVVERAPGTPFTRTAFEVQEVLKGRLPHRFVVQVIGGRLGDRMWLKAKGTTSWSLSLRRTLPRGSYTVRVRARERRGQRPAEARVEDGALTPSAGLQRISSGSWDGRGTSRRRAATRPTGGRDAEGNLAPGRVAGRGAGIGTRGVRERRDL